jgi:hypothetical protein
MYARTETKKILWNANSFCRYNVCFQNNMDAKDSAVSYIIEILYQIFSVEFSIFSNMHIDNNSCPILDRDIYELIKPTQFSPLKQIFCITLTGHLPLPLSLRFCLHIPLCFINHHINTSFESWVVHASFESWIFRDTQPLTRVIIAYVCLCFIN